MARRNSSHEQRGERWVSVSSAWTAQPPPSWIPRANPKSRRNPAPGAVATYLKWLASYNNLPEGAFLPGGEYHKDFMAGGMQSPAVQEAVSPPPTPTVNLTEAQGQKAAAKITKAAAAVVETKQQDATDAVAAIERNIAELQKKVFKNYKGEDWTALPARRGRPPVAYSQALEDLKTQLEAAKRLQGVTNNAAAVVEGAEKVTRTRKQKPADAVPVTVGAAQDATAAAEQAQAISENVADTVEQIANKAGVDVDIVDSQPSPLPPEAEAVGGDNAAEEAAVGALFDALMASSAVPAPVAEPTMTEAERKRLERKAKFAGVLGNPRSRLLRSNGARRNPVVLTPPVEKALRDLIKASGGTPSEVDEVYEGLVDYAADASPKEGQSTVEFYKEFVLNVQKNIKRLLAIVRPAAAGSPEVAKAIIETTPPAPVIPEAPAPAPSPVVSAPVVAPVSRGPAVSGEGMSDAQLEAEIKKLINEVIDEMLGENVKSNPRRRR